jgi:uncharacterized protein YndB with AHSA1/START domain
VTVTFADEGDKTKMTFHQGVFETAASRDGHEGGWSQSFERLGDYLNEPRGKGKEHEPTGR